MTNKKLARTELNSDIYKAIEVGCCMWDNIAPQTTMDLFCYINGKYGNDLILGYANQTKAKFEDEQ